MNAWICALIVVGLILLVHHALTLLADHRYSSGYSHGFNCGVREKITDVEAKHIQVNADVFHSSLAQYKRHYDQQLEELRQKRKRDQRRWKAYLVRIGAQHQIKAAFDEEEVKIGIECDHDWQTFGPNECIESPVTFCLKCNQFMIPAPENSSEVKAS